MEIGLIRTVLSKATAATATFTGALKGLWTTLKANPAVLVSTSVAALAVVTSHVYKHYQKAIHAAEDAKNALVNSQQEYNGTISELEAAETKLSEIKERIQEINNLGAPKISDKVELGNLQAQTEELEKQIVYLREKAKVQARETADNAISAYTSKVKNNLQMPVNENGARAGGWVSVADELRLSLEE